MATSQPHDMKMIQPIVEKVEAEYPKMRPCQNDELSCKNKKNFLKYVQERPRAKEENDC